MSFENKIVGAGEEDPEQLLANPANWRIHPKHQQDNLSAVLGKVGWVQHVTVNRVTGFVVDGHLRVALAISKGEPSIPVSYVELTEAEEALVLATLDPIGAMAATDQTQLADLVARVGDLPDTIAAMLSELTGATVPDEAWKDALHLDTPAEQEFEQMTFSLTKAQAEVVRTTLKKITAPSEEVTGNPNRNGNALAQLCAEAT